MNIDQIIPRTKICCLDVDKAVMDYLKTEHDVFEGSLGTKVDVSKSGFSTTLVRPNCVFPSNIQEYDVFIIDLTNPQSKLYFKSEHEIVNCESDNPRYISISSPMTIYDPIPHGALLLHNLLKKKIDKTPIFIVFQGPINIKEYTQIDSYYNNNGCFTCNNYSFVDYVPNGQNMLGHDVKSVRKIADLFFEKHLQGITYHRTFDLPERGYIPILVNINEECISFLEPLQEGGLLVMLPDIEDKCKIIKRLFENLLYPRFSKYFPLVEANSWINNPQYVLPREKALLDNKQSLYQQYIEKVKEIDNKIEKVHQNYAYLHTLLTATGEELVKAVILYLKWLGFEKVVDMDEKIGEGSKEEDIQVDLGERGLLVIEVKGICGTSTDDECMQIQKIIGRRATKHGKKDMREVYGLYIVNHERHIEPIKRQNPPFQLNQIKDAEIDERGLMTTWQLFKLYQSISDGLLSKDEARECFMQYGLIDFKPSDLVELGTPTRYWQDDTIVEMMTSVEIKVGDIVYFKHDNQWHKRLIDNIRVNDEDKECGKGNMSLKVNDKLPRKVTLYVKQ